MKAESSDSSEIGYFRIFATTPEGKRRDITLFRGTPIKISTVTFQDPFSDQTASLSFPQVTVLDQPGTGDLDWLIPYCDIDIVWENTGPYDFDWKWEGFIVDMSFSLSEGDSSFSVECKGALYQLDNYLAAPSFPPRPWPYEQLIKSLFDPAKNPARLSGLRIEFPDDWDTVVPEFENSQPADIEAQEGN